MGHDITAFKNTAQLVAHFDNECDEKFQVAYLRRNMWSGNIHLFYKALDAENKDGGVSGRGDAKTITKKQLEKAKYYILENIEDAEDRKDFTEFLDKCLKGLSKNKTVLIGFY